MLWFVVLIAVIAISIPAARWVASEDESVAADHFMDVMRDLAPGRRTIDLSCEEGSSSPSVFLHVGLDPMRRRLRTGGYERDGGGRFHRRFDGWTADVQVTRSDSEIGPIDGQTVEVTQDYDLVCSDIIDRLRDGGFRVRGP